MDKFEDESFEEEGRIVWFLFSGVIILLLIGLGIWKPDNIPFVLLVVSIVLLLNSYSIYKQIRYHLNKKEFLISKSKEHSIQFETYREWKDFADELEYQKKLPQISAAWKEDLIKKNVSKYLNVLNLSDTQIEEIENNLKKICQSCLYLFVGLPEPTVKLSFRYSSYEKDLGNCDTNSIAFAIGSDLIFFKHKPYLDMNEQQLRKVMLHELTHNFIHFKEAEVESHGEEFQRILAQVEQGIPVSEV